VRACVCACKKYVCVCGVCAVLNTRVCGVRRVLWSTLPGHSPSALLHVRTMLFARVCVWFTSWTIGMEFSTSVPLSSRHLNSLDDIQIPTPPSLLPSKIRRHDSLDPPSISWICIGVCVWMPGWRLRVCVCVIIVGSALVATA